MICVMLTVFMFFLLWYHWTVLLHAARLQRPRPSCLWHSGPPDNGVTESNMRGLKTVIRLLAV